MAARTGFGITISFASGFLAEIIDVTPPGASREKIDASHTQSPDNRKQFILADLADPGELECEIHFDPAAEPPIDSGFETVTITYPGLAAWAFSGALMSYEPTAPLEDRMTASVTIAVSGKITITPL